MNKEQLKIYEDLMKLTSENEAFYFKDFELDDITYRIFNYRLTKHLDFLEPSALECRGIMFEVYGDIPLKLSSRPMKKFFNHNEISLNTNDIANKLVLDGRLSKDVYENIKNRNNNQFIKK